MSPDTITLYPEHPGGELQANRVGSFVTGGLEFDIIRPGYDAQGRRRTGWTQFVVDGVPVYEVKVQTDLPTAMRRFNDQWARFIGGDKLLAQEAAQMARRERIAKFRDGRTGEAPSPSPTRDPREPGIRRPA